MKVEPLVIDLSPSRVNEDVPPLDFCRMNLNGFSEAVFEREAGRYHSTYPPGRYHPTHTWESFRLHVCGWEYGSVLSPTCNLKVNLPLGTVIPDDLPLDPSLKVAEGNQH